MALEVSCYDGESKHIPVESSTTAHDFAMHVLQVKQTCWVSGSSLIERYLALFLLLLCQDYKSRERCLGL